MALIWFYMGFLWFNIVFIWFCVVLYNFIRLSCDFLLFFIRFSCWFLFLLTIPSQSSNSGDRLIQPEIQETHMWTQFCIFTFSHTSCFQTNSQMSQKFYTATLFLTPISLPDIFGGRGDTLNKNCFSLQKIELPPGLHFRDHAESFWTACLWWAKYEETPSDPDGFSYDFECCFQCDSECGPRDD